MFNLQDTDLREALRRKYADTPKLPADFMERMRLRMERYPASDDYKVKPGEKNVGRYAQRSLQWFAAAASVLLIAGIGFGIITRNEERSTKCEDTQLAKNETMKIQTPSRSSNTSSPEGQSVAVPIAPSTKVKAAIKRKQGQVNLCSAKCGQNQPQVNAPIVDSPIAPDAKEQSFSAGKPTVSGKYGGDEPQYASYATADDSAYREPRHMDEFIAKMARYNKVLPVPLDCTGGTGDTTTISTAYVFPDDEQRFDVFGRLLQAACSYDSKSPGYLLNFSRKQFFFCLKDPRKGKSYLWLAERISGRRILLFCTHSPINGPTSSVCFQEYCEQLTHTNL